MSEDGQGGRRAVEAVLKEFYEAIGTPPPAPGIERLALVATEAAREGLREEWEKEVLGSVVAVQEAAGEFIFRRGSDFTTPELIEHLLRAAISNGAEGSVDGGRK